MSTLDEVHELLGFLSDRRDDVRLTATQHVLALTGSAEGAALLVRAEAAETLVRRIGDVPAVSKCAVSALINISDSPKALGQMLKKNVINSLMDGLKDRDCDHKRLNVMLLSNLCQVHNGCIQLMSMHEKETVLVGLHFRRIIQWFLAPVVPVSATGTDIDVFEYGGEVLCNVTQLKEARGILLEAERGILPALLPQVHSSSVVRRRGAAGVIRNCLFEQGRLDYLLSDGLGLVVNLVLPLAGPEPVDDDDKVGMPAAWHSAGPTKKREEDPRVRRSLVECLVLVCGTLRGRELLRRMQVYPILKHLHVHIDEHAVPIEGASAGSSSALAVAGGGAGGGVYADPDDSTMCEDDEETVEGIIKLVDFLMRKEEPVSAAAEVSAVEEGFEPTLASGPDAPEDEVVLSEPAPFAAAPASAEVD